MGDPKKSKKKYSTPLKKWDLLRIPDELELKKKYGLKNKKEIYKVRTQISKIRGIARKLQSASEEVERVRKPELMNKLSKLGIQKNDAKLDDVLGLTMEHILERRLQTIVFKKGLAKSIGQSRQFIIHGHIAIDGKRITVPSKLITVNEENSIGYYPNSVISNPQHVIRTGSDDQ